MKGVDKYEGYWIWGIRCAAGRKPKRTATTYVKWKRISAAIVSSPIHIQKQITAAVIPREDRGVDVLMTPSSHNNVVT